MRKKHEGALRHDRGKPRLDLVPPEAVLGLASVLGMGAAKYTRRYGSACHAILSAPGVTSVEVSMPGGFAATVTKRTYGQETRISLSVSGKVAESEEAETWIASWNITDVEKLAHWLGSVMRQPHVGAPCAGEDFPKKSWPQESLPDARFADAKARPGIILTIVTSQDEPVVFSVPDAITVSECWETLLKVLSGRSGIFANRDPMIEQQGERNWELGMDWGRCYASAQRHLLAFWAGEDIDPESGLPHIDHALTNLAFLSTYQKRGVGTDNRPKHETV